MRLSAARRVLLPRCCARDDVTAHALVPVVLRAARGAEAWCCAHQHLHSRHIPCVCVCGILLFFKSLVVLGKLLLSSRPVFVVTHHTEQLQFQAISRRAN